MLLRKFFYFLISLVFAGSALAIFFVSRDNKNNQYEVYTVTKKDISEQVIITGAIQPTQEIHLAFEQPGRISKTHVHVGEFVRQNAPLIELATTELYARLQRAHADVESEQARLAELERGAIEEEIQKARTRLTNAESSLTDQQKNLQAARAVAEADLLADYDILIQKIYNAKPNIQEAIFLISDIQQKYFSRYDTESLNVINAKTKTIKAFFDVDQSGRWSTEYITNLNSGLYKEISSLTIEDDFEIIKQTSTNTKNVIRIVEDALNEIPFKDEITVTDRTDVNSYKDSLNTLLQQLADAEQKIQVQLAQNQSNIRTAEEKVNNAYREVQVATDDLALVVAGSTDETLAIQQARIKSAQAQVNEIYAEIEKRVLRAPFDGVVSRFDIETGELVTTGETVISLISDNAFELEAFIPESQIATVSIDDTATILLDAYKDGPRINAQVTEIEPAETIRNNVPTYKTTFTITETPVEIKQGMSGTITLITNARDEVIAIPEYLIFTNNNQKSVRILNEKTQKLEIVSIETGLRGSDGTIEIMSGLQAGDKVVIKSL